jgi:hypothetical protein
MNLNTQIYFKLMKSFLKSLFLLFIMLIFCLNQNNAYGHTIEYEDIKTEKHDSISPKKKKRLSIKRPEFFWALTHPFSAPKAFKISKIALLITDSIEADSILQGSQGGSLDAFRHGIWMLMLCDAIGEKKALALGTAHEKANRINFKRGRTYSSYHHTKMDSINNVKACKLLRENMSKKQMTEEVLGAVKMGYFVIIKKNSMGLSIDRSGVPIETTTRKWNYHEVLIPSGQLPAE